MTLSSMMKGAEAGRVCVQNMQSSNATYESILPGSNSMRLARSGLPGLSTELSPNAAPQLTSAEAKKVGLLELQPLLSDH